MDLSFLLPALDPLQQLTWIHTNHCQPSLSTYSVPGTMLGTQQVLIHLIQTPNSLSPHFAEEEREGLERFLWSGSLQSPPPSELPSPAVQKPLPGFASSRRKICSQRRPLEAAKMSYSLVNRSDAYQVRMAQAALPARLMASSRLPGTQGASVLSRGT